MALGVDTTSGISLVCDPYGRVIAESGINIREAIKGETSTVKGETLYTR